MIYNKIMDDLVNRISFLSKSKFFTHLIDCNDEFLHRHHYYEIFYIISGKITHILNGESTVLNTGEMILLKPNDLHQFKRNLNSECTHRDILIDIDLFKEICDFLSPDFYDKFLSLTADRIANLD